jgi:dTDP-glucose 4,6-dehydratase
VIPLFVTNALEDKPLRSTETGFRCAIGFTSRTTVERSISFSTRGVLGDLQRRRRLRASNLELTRKVLEILGKPSLVAHVADRPGHDRRYSLDTTKLRALGWSPSVPFDEGLRATVDWYRDNPGWWQRIRAEAPSTAASTNNITGGD